MKDIFISYASEDRDRVIPIVKALEDHGWSVWWDCSSLLPGRDIEEAIAEAISLSKCVVVLWSKISVKKTWVRGEAIRGDRRKILVPAQIDGPVELPIAFEMMKVADLTNWKGESNHEGFQLLISALTEKIGPPRARVAMSGPQRIAFEKSIPADLTSAQIQSHSFQLPIRSGNVAATQGDQEKAEQRYKEALLILKGMLERDPTNKQLQIHKRNTLVSLGRMECSQGKLDKAEQSYLESLSIMTKLVVDDPIEIESQSELINIYSLIGNVMEEQGKQEKAAQYYNEAILVARKIAEKMEGDPTSEQDKKTEWQIKIKDSLNKLGVVDKAQGKLDKAQQCFLESESIMEKLVKNRPENSEWQLELFRIKIFFADMLETSSKQ